MASQTITLGDTAFMSSGRLSWVPSSGWLLDTALTESTVARYLRAFVISTSTNTNFSNALDVTTTATGTISQSGTGNNLISAWELFESAMLIEAGSFSIELPGPQHADNDINDTQEIYRWVPSAAKRTEIDTFITAWMALTDTEKNATTLTLRDELPIPDPLQATGPLAGRSSGALSS